MVLCVGVHHYPVVVAFVRVLPSTNDTPALDDFPPSENSFLTSSAVTPSIFPFNASSSFDLLSVSSPLSLNLIPTADRRFANGLAPGTGFAMVERRVSTILPAFWFPSSKPPTFVSTLYFELSSTYCTTSLKDSTKLSTAVTAAMLSLATVSETTSPELACSKSKLTPPIASLN